VGTRFSGPAGERGVAPKPESATAPDREPEPQPDPALPERLAVPPLPGLAIGGPAAQQVAWSLRAIGASTKLLVGGAADPAELAADRAADAVVQRLADPPATNAGADRPAGNVVDALRRVAATVGRRAPADRRPETIGPAGGELDAGTEQSLGAVRRAGTPLAPHVRRTYEAAFGADLGAVRVHSGPASARLNAALGARAFTVDSDIYFGERLPSPSDPGDRHLLAHELAHTLQAGNAAQRAVVRRLAVQVIPGRVSPAKPESEAKPPTLEATPDSPMAELHPVVEPVEAMETVTPAAVTEHPASMVVEQPEPGPLIIKDVAIVGRPEQLFSGSMGDHMTAFVVHRKGIEHALIGKSIPDAVAALGSIIDDLPKLPGWDLIDSLKPPALEEPRSAEGGEPDTVMTGGELPSAASAVVSGEPATPDLGSPGPAESKAKRVRASHYDRFVDAKKHLTTSRELLAAADTPDQQLLRLQDCASHYLELRELVPLSVADWKGANRSRGGRGDAETPLRGLLDPPGTHGPGLLRVDFLSSIATYRMAQAAVEPNADALATFMPGLNPKLAADERTELLARQHVQSILTNFPDNFAALAEEIQPSSGGTATSMELEEKEEEEPRARTVRDNFRIILSDLIGVVKEQYQDAALAEYHAQLRIIRLGEEDSDQVRQASSDARALERFLPDTAIEKPVPSVSAETLGPDAETSGRPKRSRAGSNRFSAAAHEERDDPRLLAKKKEEEAAQTRRKLKLKGRESYSGSVRIATAERAHDLSVQLLLDAGGKITDIQVERAGKHTEGAHTIPWMQWVQWMAADVRTKEPAVALAVFRAKTVPKILGRLPKAVSTAASTVGEAIAVEEEEEPRPLAVEEEEAEERAADLLPLMQLQTEMSQLFETITSTEGVSVLDAVDTGHKAEAYHRRQLQAFEDGKKALSADQCLDHILGLCDVGEAEDEMAEETIRLVLKQAVEEYPKAYALSKIATMQLADLVALAKAGKDRDFVDDEGSDSAEEARTRKKPKVATKKDKARSADHL
jgi:Domain of unknown function (DUF4157)